MRRLAMRHRKLKISPSPHARVQFPFEGLFEAFYLNWLLEKLFARCIIYNTSLLILSLSHSDTDGAFDRVPQIYYSIAWADFNSMLSAIGFLEFL